MKSQGQLRRVQKEESIKRNREGGGVVGEKES